MRQAFGGCFFKARSLGFLDPTDAFLEHETAVNALVSTPELRAACATPPTTDRTLDRHRAPSIALLTLNLDSEDLGSEGGWDA